MKKKKKKINKKKLKQNNTIVCNIVVFHHFVVISNDVLLCEDCIDCRDVWRSEATRIADRCVAAVRGEQRWQAVTRAAVLATRNGTTTTTTKARRPRRAARCDDVARAGVVATWRPTARATLVLVQRRRDALALLL